VPIAESDCQKLREQWQEAEQFLPQRAKSALRQRRRIPFCERQAKAMAQSLRNVNYMNNALSEKS